MISQILPPNIIDPITFAFQTILPKIPLAIFSLLIGIVIIRVLSWIAQFIVGFARIHAELKSIIISMIDALLWIFLVISVLQTLGLDNLALAFSGSLAAVGLAMGVGGATLASDILGGIFLAGDRDFNVGDEIKAGENGTIGILEKMDMRRIRMRDKEGKLHVIPNSVIERKEWVVLTKKKDL